MKQKLFKVLDVRNQIVDVYDDGEVIEIYRYLKLATYGLFRGGIKFEVKLDGEDALKNFIKDGFVMADIHVCKNKFTGLNDYTVKSIVPLEQTAVIHGEYTKLPWEYIDDDFNF